MFPLAAFCVLTAVMAMRTHALPAWLGIGAGITAIALVVNGAVLDASFVPAIVVFLLWSLVASIHLVRVGTEPRAGVAQPALP
jgi:hypothetical protein